MVSKTKLFCSALLITLPLLADAQSQSEIGQLKAYQGKLRAHDSNSTAQSLQNHGHDSAHQIAPQPPSHFIQNNAFDTTLNDGRLSI